jgi:hypothetical protein
VGLQNFIRPQQLPNLAALYDISDIGSLRNNAGAVPSTGEGIKLVSDKSGNSSVNCLVLNGVVGNYASAPDSVPLSITGDIDLRCDVALNDWTPAGVQALVSKDTTSNRCYSLFVSTDGTVRFIYTSDGSTTAGRTAISTVATGITDFSRSWIRATYASASGNVNFYTSTDGVSWTQLGAQVAITSGAIFNGTNVLEIGSSFVGTASVVSGLIYRAQIYNGIAGTLAFDANFATASKLATSFPESSSNAATVTINTSGATGARISGARDLYQGTAANQPVYLPWSGTNYGYLNGTAGTSFTATVNATSGEIDIQFFALCRNFASNPYMLSTTAAEGSIRILSSGNVRWTRTSTKDATIPPPGLTTTGTWVRMVYNTATGAINHYYGSDGTNWTANGSGVVGTGALTSGTWTLGLLAASYFNGNIQRFRVYDDGVLVADYNPGLYTSGATFTGGAAETWTINGGANIVTKTSLYFDGSNDYLKAAAFSLSQPETVYFVGSQVTWTNADGILDGNTLLGMSLRQAALTPEITASAGNGIGPVSLATGTNGIVSAVFNGASSSVRINRAAAATGNASTNNAGGFTLGARGDATNPANITAQEVVVYSEAHNTATQNLVIQYEATKFGISL